MPQTVSLINPVLGLDPFILIECPAGSAASDGEAAFDVKIRAGGGLDSTDEMVALLLLVVESITGVDPDLYVTQIDLTRRAAAAGGAALGEVIGKFRGAGEGDTVSESADEGAGMSESESPDVSEREGTSESPDVSESKSE